MVAPHWISGSRLYFWRMIFPKMECQLHKLSGKPALHGESTLVMSDFFKENLPTFSWLTRVWIKTRSTSTILHLFGSEHFIALYSCNRCSVYIYTLYYSHINISHYVRLYPLIIYIHILILYHSIVSHYIPLHVPYYLWFNLILVFTRPPIPASSKPAPGNFWGPSCAVSAGFSSILGHPQRIYIYYCKYIYIKRTL
jgi:hypothetical protein